METVCRHTGPDPRQWQEKPPFNRKKPRVGPGSYGKGGEKEEKKQTYMQESTNICLNVTKAALFSAFPPPPGEFLPHHRVGFCWNYVVGVSYWTPSWREFSLIKLQSVGLGSRKRHRSLILFRLYLDNKNQSRRDNE